MNAIAKFAAAVLALAPITAAAAVKCERGNMDDAVRCETEYRGLKGGAGSYSLGVTYGRASLAVITTAAMPAYDGPVFLRIDGGALEQLPARATADPMCAGRMPMPACTWSNLHMVNLPPGTLRRLAGAREILFSTAPNGNGARMDPARFARWLADLERQGAAPL